MEETVQKRRDKKKMVGYSLLAFVIVLICVYICLFTYYQERFLANTELNGMDVSKKTIQDVLDIYKGKGESYHLSIQENGKELLQIKGTDIDLKYEIESSIREMVEKQNFYRWWQAYFKNTKKTVEEKFSYDAAKVAELLKGEMFLPEPNRKAPKSAEIIFDGENFVIQKEQAGTQFDAGKLEKLVTDRISSLDQTGLELAEEDCYIQPSYTEQSPEVILACEQMNGYCKAQITYRFSGKRTEQISKKKIAEWVTLGENWKPEINQDAAKAYLKTLSEKYGGQINVEKELPLLMSDIQNQKIAERTFVPKQKKVSRKIQDAGTYVEVDLTSQHMWYVENGKVVFECDVVTGLPTDERRTPAGTYRITEKMQNKTLTGNIDPATGKPEYQTPVDYWMRITSSGIGFHDATWQSSFGGNRYKSHGSHGCINMPYGAAKKLYGMVSVGTRTVIHY